MKNIQAFALSVVTIAQLLVAAGSVQLSNPFLCFLVPFSAALLAARKASGLWDEIHAGEME